MNLPTRLLLASVLALTACLARADDFVPAEQAYRYRVTAEGGALVVRYDIQAGYYLYRKRLGFATDTPGVTLGEPAFPTGLPHTDDYFGTQEIYRGATTIKVPYSIAGAAPAALRLTLKLQGCADAGLCYPPQNWTTQVALPASAPGAAGGSGAAGKGALLGTLLGGNAPAAADGFLPVDEAYRATLAPDAPGRLRLVIAIADGYYLYRDKIQVKTDDTRLTLAPLSLPEGLAHEDAYFGRQQIFRQQVEGTVQATGPAGVAGPFQVSLSYQGCADAGLCYPPQTKTLSVSLTPAAAAAPAGAGPPLLAVLGLALLGGLVLNLMPCVLPVLSIKAVSLAAAADADAAGTRAKGFAYAAGVIGSMLVLAGALLALRAAGEQIGWGFQLQSPRFVLALCYLLMLVGLNLSGVFEVGASLQGAGDALTRGDSTRASFFTGVLTTLVATPCTAPFMATAVGIALTQSAAVGLAVFAALGLGLSIPYLLLALVPAARHLLPKPGVWMNHFKQALAFPMYASAGWLLWVLARQASATLLAAAIFGLVLIALAAWCYELRKTVRGGWRHVNAAVAVLALVGAGALPAGLHGASATPRADEAHAKEGFSPARVEALVRAGRPVFVIFTADWCVTCKVNEHVAIDNDAVQALFHSKGVETVTADWTNQDTVISRELARHGRAGVPLYLFYKPRAAAPEVLPQVLTPGLLRDLAGSLPDAPTA